MSVSSHEHRSNVGKAVWETVKSQTLSRLSHQRASIDELSSVLLNKMITGHGMLNNFIFVLFDFHFKYYGMVFILTKMFPFKFCCESEILIT